MSLSAIAEAYLYSEEVLKGFCEGCEEITTIPATLYLPSEKTCPCFFEVGGSGCPRKAEWEEMIRKLKEVEVSWRKRT